MKVNAYYWKIFKGITFLGHTVYYAAVAGMKATVVYSYDADQEDELSLAVGDVIRVIAQVLLLTYFSVLDLAN